MKTLALCGALVVASSTSFAQECPQEQPAIPLPGAPLNAPSGNEAAAIRGDVMAFARQNPSTVEIYRYDGLQWTLEQSVATTITNGGGIASIDIDGNDLAVGIPGIGMPGEVHMYIIDPTTNAWILNQVLVSSDASGVVLNQTSFGTAVGLATGLLSVGAPLTPWSDGTEGVPGAAFNFRDIGTWIPATTPFLQPGSLGSPPIAGTLSDGARYGISVDLSPDGQSLIVGAPGHRPGANGDCPEVGVAYVHVSGLIFPGFWDGGTAYGPPGSPFVPGCEVRAGQVVSIDGPMFAVVWPNDGPFPTVRVYRTDVMPFVETVLTGPSVDTAVSVDGDTVILGDGAAAAEIWVWDAAQGTLVLQATPAGALPPMGRHLDYSGGFAVASSGAMLSTECDALTGTQLCDQLNPNSTGEFGQTFANGYGASNFGTLTLTATNMPPGEIGYFVSGMQPGAIAGFGPPPGLGILCMGVPFARHLPVQVVDAAGMFEMTIDTSAIPLTPPVGVQPGETWWFQGFFRDAGYNNVTNAIEMMFF